MARVSGSGHWLCHFDLPSTAPRECVSYIPSLPTILTLVLTGLTCDDFFGKVTQIDLCWTQHIVEDALAGGRTAGSACPLCRSPCGAEGLTAPGEGPSPDGAAASELPCLKHNEVGPTDWCEAPRQAKGPDLNQKRLRG